MASSLAVETLASILQHPLKALAPAPKEPERNKENDAESSFNNPLSEIPHQLRGFLHNFSIMKIWGPSYSYCSACSPAIVNAWRSDGWEFVKKALNTAGLVEEICGLKEVQRQAEELNLDASWSDSDVE